MSKYDLDIFYIPGKELAIVDNLSRLGGYPSKITISNKLIIASFLAEYDLAVKSRNIESPKVIIDTISEIIPEET